MRIINELGIDGVVDIGSRLVAHIRDRLDESRSGILNRIYGEVESTNGALGQLIGGINRLRDQGKISPEQAGQFLDDITGVLEEATFPSLGSIASLTNVWNSVWSDEELSDTEQQELRTALEDVLQSAGIDSQRVDSLLDTAEQVYDIVSSELENADSEFDYHGMLTGIQQILQGLPEIDFPGALDDTVIEQVAQQVVELVRGDGGVSTIISLVDIFQDAGLELTSPSLGATLSLVAEFQSARSDGVIVESERPRLRSSLDQFFASMGMDEATRTALLDGINAALDVLQA